jgi:hypothetical protein
MSTLTVVDVMLRRLDLQGIGHHLGAGVRRRAQAYSLCAQGDLPVIPVAGDVMDGGLNAHWNSLEK